MIKRFFALIGALCASWIITSILFFVVIAFVSIFKKLKRGNDALTNTSILFYNLPIWVMVPVILLATYSVLYAIRNKALLKKYFEKFSESMFQD